jgi:hypothetical protein
MPRGRYTKKKASGQPDCNPRHASGAAPELNVQGVFRMFGVDMRYLPRLTALTLAVLSHLAFAGNNSRSVTAVRTETPPVVDGVLNDPVWNAARPATGFTQHDPVDGDSASERTEVRILFDGEALYFGVMCFDSRPERIVARLARRDDEVPSDWASVRIDADRDRLSAYEFSFNPAGVKVDILQYDDGEAEDPTWDAVWDLQVSRGESGWSAELKIPFSMLRYYEEMDDTTEQIWGINFTRYITRLNESSRWAHSPKSEGGFVSRFGELRGLQGLPRTRPLQLLPFGVAEYRHAPGTETVLPVDRTRFDAGLDLKYGIGSNLTLDMTVRPDFGQVEADPAVLNLSTIETFYPEQRPFFIEGFPIISFPTFGGGSGLFYSRRIGRAIDPEAIEAPEGSGVEEVAPAVGIIGAAKLTGRLSNGLSIGALQAVTQREWATVRDETGTSSSTLVEPLASFTVVRLRQEVASMSTVGGIATATLKEDRRPALTAGADWALRFGENAYLLDGFLAGSSTTNGGDAYITGTAGRIQLERVAALHWLWEVGTDFTTPRYNVNDVGFFRRPNDYGLMGSLAYKEDIPGGWFQSYAIDLSLHERSNFDGANINREARLAGECIFRNFWELSADVGYDAGEYDDRETRGNGLYDRPVAGSAAAFLSTDDRDPVSFSFGQRFGWDDLQKEFSATEVGIEIRPMGWFQLDLETEYQRTRDQEAWVENLALSGGTASIFGDRSTDQIDFQMRGTVVFTRDLTLQFYGQVFVAQGAYKNFRRLTTPSSFEPYAYTGSPDFLSQSIIGNVVFRWEYRPGSTLYLVWSHAKDAGEAPPGGSLADGMRGAFRLPPANVVLLKVNYWLEI